MAKAGAHAFGQVIGELLEKATKPSLQAMADEFGMYLDYKHPRPTRTGKSKDKSLVSWIDSMGNSHDLDYVLEQGGSEKEVGRPRAFIEIAWRRYTKHSKNKAQEIEGAIGHLAARYHDLHPFLGAVLAGVFTAPSLKQLRSHRFTILYFTYDSVIAAFSKLGVDARYDEKTTDSFVFGQLAKYKALSHLQRDEIAEELRTLHESDIDEFVASLRAVLNRAVETISVVPLHGSPTEVKGVEDAIRFVRSYSEGTAPTNFARYEVVVRYTNGSRIEGRFRSKEETVEFLNRMV